LLVGKGREMPPPRQAAGRCTQVGGLRTDTRQDTREAVRAGIKKIV